MSTDIAVLDQWATAWPSHEIDRVLRLFTDNGVSRDRSRIVERKGCSLHLTRHCTSLVSRLLDLRRIRRLTSLCTDSASTRVNLKLLPVSAIIAP